MSFDDPDPLSREFPCALDEARAARIRFETALQELVPEAVTELEDGRTDGAALNALARGLSPLLLRFVAQRAWGLDDPERLASEALARVLLRLRSFDPTRGSLVGWAFFITKNTIIDELRDRHATENPEPSAYERKRQEQRHLRDRLSDDQRSALLGALFSLSADDQYLLHLTMVEQLSASEAGRHLGLSGDAVRKRKERLLRQFEAIGPSE